MYVVRAEFIIIVLGISTIYICWECLLYIKFLSLTLTVHNYIKDSYKNEVTADFLGFVCCCAWSTEQGPYLSNLETLGMQENTLVSEVS